MSIPLAFVAAPAIAAAYVLVIFQALPTPVNGAVRGLLIAVLGAAAIQLLLLWLLRNAVIGSLTATAIVLIVIGFWPVALLGALAAFLSNAWLASSRGQPITRPQGDAPAALARAVGLFALLLMIVAVLSLPWGALYLYASGSEGEGVPAEVNPDLFVIVLDGYPRSDVLSARFDYDNRWFESALEARGFDIAAQSQSNYSSTWPTFASMLSMRYLDDLSGLVPFATDPVEQHQDLMAAIRDAPALEMLRAHGYEILTVPSPFDGVTLTSADRHLSTGRITRFEMAVIDDTLIGGLLNELAPQVLLDQQRSGVIRTLETTADEASSDASHPRFLLTHVMSPHPPYVFGHDGERIESPSCYPETCSFWDGDAEDLAGQVHYLNRLVLETLDRVIETQPAAVVVVMSDHGIAPSDHAEERLNNLLALRSPGRSGVLPENASLVNVFPHLYNAYFDTALEPLPYRGWVSEGDAPLTLTPVEGNYRP